MTQPAALYDSFIAEYYDHSPILQRRTEDIAFYAGVAKRYGDPVLELGCGTGRVTKIGRASCRERVYVLV